MGNYKEITDPLFFKMLLDRLKIKIDEEIQHGGTLKVSFYDPRKVNLINNCLSLEDYLDPVKVPIVCGEFLIPNIDKLPLLSFYMGINKNILKIMRTLTDDEEKLFGNILDPEGSNDSSTLSTLSVFNSFSNSITLVACFLSKKYRDKEITVKKNEVDDLESKKEKSFDNIIGAKVRLKNTQKELLEFEEKFKMYLNYFND